MLVGYVQNEVLALSYWNKRGLCWEHITLIAAYVSLWGFHEYAFIRVMWTCAPTSSRMHQSLNCALIETWKVPLLFSSENTAYLIFRSLSSFSQLHKLPLAQDPAVFLDCFYVGCFISWFARNSFNLDLCNNELCSWQRSWTCAARILTGKESILLLYKTYFRESQ